MSDMSNKYQIEVTDTFAGEANYSWVKRSTLFMPELTDFGYDGSTNYCEANKRYNRQLVRKVKAFAGWTGLRCIVENHGDMITIRPRNACMVAFATFQD